jgi:RNA polymerase sporulation-specific sigma factor
LIAPGISDTPGLCFGRMQDEDVVRIAKRGDFRATEYLIGRYRTLVESKARAYFLIGADHEDVIQEGMIGLCKAIRDFRSDRLSKFRPFAELCVTRQIITAVKTATRQKHGPLNAYVSLNRPVSPDDMDGSLMDVIPDRNSADPEALLMVRKLPVNLHAAVEPVLSDLEGRVLKCYLDGKSYREMSVELECHTKSIDNALQRVKRKIGQLFKD